MACVAGSAFESLQSAATQSLQCKNLDLWIYPAGHCSMQMYPLLSYNPIVRAGRAANGCSCTLEPWVDIKSGRVLGNASLRSRRRV
jgi:hypothetical protein